MFAVPSFTFLFLSSTGFTRHEPIKNDPKAIATLVLSGLIQRDLPPTILLLPAINADRSAADRHVGFAYPVRGGIRRNQEIRVELPRYFKRFDVGGI